MTAAANGPPHAVPDVATGITPLPFDPVRSEQRDRDLPLGGAGEVSIEGLQHELQALRCEASGRRRVGHDVAPREPVESSDRRQPWARETLRNGELGEQIGRIEKTDAGNRELDLFVDKATIG